MTKNILYTNELFPVRLVFLIDILLTGISFILSYFLCSFILPDIWSHGMLIQLPIIVALTSLIFLFIGIYKGYVNYDKVREVYSIFNAICLTNILTIILVVVNGKLFMEEELMVPLSIIVVHSILSFIAMAASRYIYKRVTASKSKLLNKQEHIVFIYNNDIKNGKIKTVLSLLKKMDGKAQELVPFNDFESFKEIFASNHKNSLIQGYFIYKDSAQQNSICYKWLTETLSSSKPVYLVDLKFENKALEQNELLLSKVLLSELGEKRTPNSQKMKTAILKAAMSKENSSISDNHAVEL